MTNKFSIDNCTCSKDHVFVEFSTGRMVVVIYIEMSFFSNHFHSFYLVPKARRQATEKNSTGRMVVVIYIEMSFFSNHFHSFYLVPKV